MRARAAEPVEGEDESGRPPVAEVLALADELDELVRKPARLRASTRQREEVRVHRERRVENLRVFGAPRKRERTIGFGDRPLRLAAPEHDFGLDLSCNGPHVVDLADIREKRLRSSERRVPRPAEIVVVRKLDLAPEDETAHSKTSGEVDRLLPELARARELAGVAHDRPVVAERTQRLR
jgi:hypothetical protein